MGKGVGAKEERKLLRYFDINAEELVQLDAFVNIPKKFLIRLYNEID